MHEGVPSFIKIQEHQPCRNLVIDVALEHDICWNILCLHVDKVLVSLPKDQPTSGEHGASVIMDLLLFLTAEKGSSSEG